MCYSAYFVDAKSAAFQPKSILPVAAGVIPDGACIRQCIFDNNGVAADERVLADPAELMHAGIGADGRIVFNDHVTRQCSPICENCMVADPAVVRYVSLGHEEVFRSDFGDAPSTFRATLQRRELSECIARARWQDAALAFELQVLRRLTRGHKWKEHRAGSKLRRAFDDAMTRNANLIAQNYIVADD